MKRPAILFAVILSVLLLSFPAFADEDVKPIEISAGNIEELVLKYNLDAMSAKLSLDKAKEDYEDLKDSLDDLQDSYDAIDTGTPDGASASVSLGLQLTSLRSSRSTAAYSLKSAEIQYNQLVSARVAAATESYIACLSDRLTNETNAIKLESLRRELELSEKSREKGRVSDDKYEDALEAYKDQAAEIEFENGHISARLDSLRAAVGIPNGTLVSVVPLEEPDFSPLDSLVYEDELTEMLENSTAIGLAELELEKAQTARAKSEYNIKTAEISLEQAREAAIDGFKAEYDAMIEAYKRLEEGLADLEKDKTDLELMRKKYGVGRVSLRELNDKEDEIRLSELKLSSDENSLYTKYLAYLRTKAGY